MENKIKSLIKKLRRFGFSVKPKNKGLLDPVCGMEAANDIAFNYRGQTYFFCSDHCRGQFEKAPDRYSGQ
ncbi:MAG: YHS domain-containing protein [Parcubacteria group bacterium]|nr:YHS domain-containing protein [Parcubacteria group bacterium]